MLPQGSERQVTVTAILRHGEVTLLTLMPDADFVWRPGQYLSIRMPEGGRRSFSLAAPYRPGAAIELHVGRRPGGRFSDTFLPQLSVGDRVSISGPYGALDWRDGSGPMVLLGTGTGLAPLKAIIEHGLAAGSGRPMRLYWGARRLEDLYLSETLRSWAGRYPSFTFIPVLVTPPARWSGRTGYVQDAAVADLRHLHHTDVYACGAPVMIARARDTLSALPGWQEERFLTDPFEAAQDPPVMRDDPAVSVIIEGTQERRTLRAACGSTLLAALQAAGAPILSICGGKASCGECRVTIHPAWVSRLTPAARAEQRLLAYLEGAGPLHRLSCQIRLRQSDDGLTVRLHSTVAAAWSP